MKHVAAAILLAASLSACATAPAAYAPYDVTSPEAETEMVAILALLEAQDVAWNAGDIDAFMSGYWNSPDLRFASGGNVTRGWDGTNARYKATYDTAEKMGTLTTGEHEISLLAPDGAVVHGSWKLDRVGDTPSGLYTLVFRKIDGAWKIVSDTTTSAEE